MSKIVAPRVFISYAWDKSSEPVEELARKLVADGVDIVLDIWELKEGQDKYQFMEQCVSDSSIYKVLIICDKSYCEKANNREGGVGDETAIISPEIYGHAKQEKFIPIIFEKNEESKPYVPAYIKSRIHIDLSDNSTYAENYEKLLRNIHNKPLKTKPALGKVPKYLNEESIGLFSLRTIISKKKYTTTSFKLFGSEFIEKLLELSPLGNPATKETILILIEKEKLLRDLYLDWLISCMIVDIPFGDIIPSFFEELYNRTHDTRGLTSRNKTDFEFYDFVIWELFLCTVTILLHYEKYGAINSILTYSYYINPTQRNDRFSNYSHFQKYLLIIEEQCKPNSENPRYFTLAGEILVRREYKSVITKDSLGNTDVILYQLFPILRPARQNERVRGWFPSIYYYCPDPQSIWAKLESKNHCEKLFPLFRVDSIDNLKKYIESNKLEPAHYNNDYYGAHTILSNIDLGKIGIIN